MRAFIYFLAGVALVVAAAGAIAYGSDNLRTLSESGVAQEAPKPTTDSYGTYGEGEPGDNADTCGNGATPRSAQDSYGRPSGCPEP